MGSIAWKSETISDLAGSHPDMRVRTRLDKELYRMEELAQSVVCNYPASISDDDWFAQWATKDDDVPKDFGIILPNGVHVDLFAAQDSCQ